MTSEIDRILNPEGSATPFFEQKRGRDEANHGDEGDGVVGISPYRAHQCRPPWRISPVPGIVRRRQPSRGGG